MSALSLDLSAREVANKSVILRNHGRLVSLGNNGGFSGSLLWRWEGEEGRFCIKAWPEGPLDTSILALMHSCMRKALDDGLSFVPSLLTTEFSDNRLWEITTWMPGTADFHRDPLRPKLEAALTSLAQLHVAWQSMGSSEAPSTSVGLERRIARADEWTQRIQSGWRPVATTKYPVEIQALLSRSWPLLVRWLQRILPMLQKWRRHVPRLQPCLCDIWHDHVLFEGDRVSGVIDYGSLRIDAPTMDLARLLGSLIGDDQEAWSIGLGTYRRVRSLSTAEEELAHDLDRTGVIIGLANWVKWLCIDKRTYEDAGGVARRIRELIDRVERWQE